MEYILRERCECGGRIAIVYCKEEVNGIIEELVSHGVCTECLKNICLPMELYWTFVRKYCYLKEEI